jgi:hypothetical protein
MSAMARPVMMVIRPITNSPEVIWLPHSPFAVPDRSAKADDPVKVVVH